MPEHFLDDAIVGVDKSGEYAFVIVYGVVVVVVAVVVVVVVVVAVAVIPSGGGSYALDNFLSFLVCVSS